MPRPTPPMYAKVPRKVPAKAILMPLGVVPAAEPAVEVPLVLATEPPAEEEEGSEEEEILDEEGEATLSDGPVEWSEDMTRKDLYHLAKRAGLNVVSRDSKAKRLKRFRRLGK